MFRCLKVRMPWHCVSRKSPTCAETVMMRGMASLLSLTLLASVIVGVLSIN